MMRFHLLRQDRDAEQRRKQHRDNPRHDQGNRYHHEQGEGEFTSVAAVEANWDESRHGHQRAGQHGKGGRRVDVGRRLLQGIAHFQPRHHHFDCDHCVVDQKAKGDDQCAERNTLQRNPGIRHHDKRDREHQRDGDRNNQTGAKPKAEEADTENNDDCFEERFREARDRVLDDHRLIRDQMDSHADRQVGCNLRHFLLQSIAELQEIGARLHPDGESNGGLTVEAKQRRRRIGVTARNGGHIR